MKPSSRHSGLLRALAGAALWFCGAAQAATFGDVSVLAQVPVPNGFPEGLAVHNGRVYTAGPATLGTAFNGKPSRVFEFDASTGELLRTLITQGEKTFGAGHADSCLAFDGKGRLYVLNTQLGTYRLDLGSEQQSLYSPALPNLRACLPLGLSKGACSTTPINQPALPNDIAFDDQGYAYISDSAQAAIWRVPPGGGPAQLWFQDYRLASAYIGVNGLRISPDRSQVFFTVTLDLLGQGWVYTLPLIAQPLKSDLKVFHYYPASGPDGIAFGASGKLYVALALPGSSGISVLNPNGSEAARMRNPLLSPLAPFDSPANIAFDGAGNLLVSNHAFLSGLLLPRHFQILKVFVDDYESPLAEPLL
jgi:sugar lactone lactonase YvrE